MQLPPHQGWGHAEVTGSPPERNLSSVFTFSLKSQIFAAGLQVADDTSANKYWRKCCGGICLIDAVLSAF